MFRRFSMLVLGLALAGTPAVASAQELPPMFPTIAGDFAMIQVHRQALDQTLENQRGGGTPDTQDAALDAVAPGQATLTYAPSTARRRANLAEFAEKTRETDPQSGASLDALFASGDVIDRMGGVLAPYGYSVANVGDAYAMWWLTAWNGARGVNDIPTAAQMRGVQAQAHAALLATPQLAGTSDADKQQMAEALLLQAMVIDAAVDQVKQQPELLPQLQQAIRQGASASGVNLDAMQLAADGFVNR